MKIGHSIGMISLASDEAHYWIRVLTGAAPPEAEELLSAEEMGRAAAIGSAQRRNDFVESRVLLRKILAEYVAMPAGEMEIVAGEGVKPRLADADRIGLHFNISHAAGLLAIVVARHPLVGVDIESVDRDVDAECLANRFFSDDERSSLTSAVDMRFAFLRTWTAKEAILKATGAGYAIPLASISGESRRIDHDGWRDHTWKLWDIELPASHVGTVAAPPEVILYRRS